MLLGTSCTWHKVEELATCETDGDISFNNDVLPILVQQCATEACHSGQNPEGNLNLEAAFAFTELTTGNGGYVDTLNPDLSLLYAQMNSLSDPMPPEGRLDDCILELILDWISQGAREN